MKRFNHNQRLSFAVNYYIRSINVSVTQAAGRFNVSEQALLKSLHMK